MEQGKPVDAFFAGKVFVPGEQDGYRFFLWGEADLNLSRQDRMSFTSTSAEPAEGAFLCELPAGWLFVVGARKNSPAYRHTFFDDSAKRSDNARAMQDLGVPVISLDDADKRVRDDRVPLYSVTGDEQKRAEALARHAR